MNINTQQPNNVQQATLESLEALKANSKTILIELSSSTIITCEGDDASTFLQGQLTCDILKLGSIDHDQYITLGSCCNTNGKMVGLFYVVKHSDTCLWIIATKSNAPQILKHLGKYSIFSKVTLQTMPTALPLFGVMLAPQHQKSDLAPDSILSLGLHDRSLYFTTMPDTLINNAALDCSTSITEDYWDLALMLSGLPKFDATLSDTLMPSDLHLDELGGISYNKGCYTGQEPIARLHFKGKPKFTCRLLKWQTDILLHGDQTSQIPPKFQTIHHHDKKVGSFIQKRALANNQWLGLARLRIDSLTSSTPPYFKLEHTNCNAEIAKVAYNTRRGS